MRSVLRASIGWAWRSYAGRMLRRASRDTWQLISDLYFHDIKRTIASAIPPAIALGLLFLVGQGEVAGEEVTIMGALMLVLAAFVVVLFLVSLFMSPSRVARSAVANAVEPVERNAAIVAAEVETLRGVAATLATRIEELEEARVPKLTAECHVERGLPLGERLSLAYLVLTNQGEQGIQNAHAQLRVVEHWGYLSNDEHKPCRDTMYKHQDVFLKWDASESRTHSFQAEAKLRVALGVKGTGNVIFQAVQGGLSPEAQLFTIYELDVTIAADNYPALKVKLYLRMVESSYRNEEGDLVLIDGPYPVEFRPWADDDFIEDETDIDASRP